VDPVLRRRSLRGRLAWALGITAALSVAATALITFALVRQYAQHQALQQLQRQASAAAADARARESEGAAPSTAMTAALRQLLQGTGDRVVYVGPTGRIISGDTIATSVAGAIDLSPVLAGTGVRGTVHVSQGEFAYVGEPVPGRRAGGVAGVVLSRPVGLAATVWRPVIGRVLLAGAVAVLVAVAASLWIARRLAAPLRKMAAATRSVAAGDLAHRVPVEGDSEVADLARQFNDMAEARAAARRREHEFLANVSHELRSPLTAIRGYAEALSDGTAGDDGARAEAVRVIGDEAARLELLLADVMDLARLGAREFRLEPREVALDATLGEAVAARAGRAAEAGVALTNGCDPGLAGMKLITDPLRVGQIVGNLVDNALRVTPPGGTVAVAGHRRGAEFVVEVSDTGPGISATDLPHVFERSYLWGKSQKVLPTGTGLGLAIVRELAVALGGRIDVESQPGRGTTFALHLPAR
jgi:two-component system sensor histidine kinase BaeS